MSRFKDVEISMTDRETNTTITKKFFIKNTTEDKQNDGKDELELIQEEVKVILSILNKD